METNLKNIDDVQVVGVSGRIDTVTSKELDDVLNGLIDRGDMRMVVDLSGVEYVSSAGLRVLIAVLKRLKAAGGVLKLASLRPVVREVFEITGFTKLFSIYTDMDEAVASFLP